MPWDYTLPRFATSASADVTEPSESKKDLGWIAERPPHEFFNWLHENTYIPLLQLDKLFNPRSLIELDEALDVGDVGRLAPTQVQGFGFPDPILADPFPGDWPGTVTAMACNSTLLFVAAGGSVSAVSGFSKDFAVNAAEVTYTLSGTGNVERIAASPSYVAVAWVDGGLNFFVDLFTVDGTRQWTYSATDAGGGVRNIEDLAINESQECVIVGDGRFMRVLDITLGTVALSVNCDADIQGVVTTREYAVVICDPAGASGDLTSGREVFCYDLKDSAIRWQRTVAGGTTTGAQAVCTNGSRVFVACDNAGNLASIYVFSLFTGDAWNYGGNDITGSLGGPFPVDGGTTTQDPHTMACDDRFIYLETSTGIVIVDQWDYMPVQVINSGSTSMCCDFDRLFTDNYARQTPQYGLPMAKVDASSDRVPWCEFSLVPAGKRMATV